MTDVGKTRTRNEDSWSLVPGLGVAVVADGMGGHPGGDVASRIAADTAADMLRQELEREPQAGETAPDRLSSAMRRSVLRAHEQIRARGQVQPELDGMGTTITAFAVDPSSDLFVLGNVGDSRAYRFRSGELARLTRDDTWVQERVEAKQLTPDQARRHPFAHLLTQCLGLEDTPKPRITEGTVQVGDAYLLCTDGLVGMVDDATLAGILASELGNGSANAESALRRLLDAANDAGGFDNITAVLVTIVPAAS
jgi:protein phosphatase